MTDGKREQILLSRMNTCAKSLRIQTLRQQYLKKLIEVLFNTPLRKTMLQILMILFICSLDLLSAHPMEEPTKFTLGNIQNNAENAVPSKLEITKELLERVGDAIRIGRGRFVNLIILARNNIINRAEQINSEFNLDPSIVKSDKPQSRSSILPIQNTTPIVLFQPQEIIRLENETAQAILEKRKLDNIRQLLDTFLTPKPLVDRIKDEQKYGNSGDKFIGIGRTFINGYENFSNFLNNLIGTFQWYWIFSVQNMIGKFPVDIVKQTSRGITQTLDKLGARIVGLA
ncbi:hypothetical protein G5I_02107 [Acromyrmex echinatior]|uniref:Uncharacterized protein n=1 Tax=Acromyrmex echinatior TaxID=103372 RepID=F4W9F5_ACREC|nr:hypothetical protein G5I_02107 [Acromyrmex echinatior]